MDSYGQSLILEEMQNQSKHSNGNNISDGRLQNLACTSAKKIRPYPWFKNAEKKVYLYPSLLPAPHLRPKKDYLRINTYILANFRGYRPKLSTPAAS